MLSKLRDLLGENGSVLTVDTCQSPNCGASTREGKPYCSEHIENCTYIKSVLAEIARRESESRKLDSGEWLTDDNAHLVREALILLEYGTYSAARLGHMLDVSERAADTLIRVMSRRGLVTIAQNDKGIITASKRLRAVI